MICGSAPTGKKVLRETATDRPCPWCFRRNLTYSVFVGGSVRGKCAGSCGYEASLFKRELKPEERDALFGPVKLEITTTREAIEQEFSRDVALAGEVSARKLDQEILGETGEEAGAV